MEQRCQNEDISLIKIVEQFIQSYKTKCPEKTNEQKQK